MTHSERRDASYMEVFWPLVLSGHAIGRLEWSTGVLTLDVAKETWESIQNPYEQFVRTRDTDTAIAVYTHEMAHVMQIAILGFPYRWARDLRILVAPAVNRLGADKPEDDFAAVLDAIDLGESVFTPEELAALASHFSRLDEPSEFGVTTRSLIETYAHVVERRVNYDIKSGKDLLPHIEDAPAPEYRAPFDVLMYAVGPDLAYEWFLLICAVALCTTRPSQSFDRLVVTLADNPDILPDTLTPDNALQCQRDLADIVESDLIGSASQVAAVHADSPNRRLVDAAAEALLNGDFEPIWAYAAPHKVLGSFVPLLDVPVFLRPVQPQGFACRLPKGMDRAEGLAYLAMAAVVSQLTASIEARSRAVGSQALDGLEWLRWDRSPIAFGLDMGQVATQDVKSLLRIADPGSNTSATGRELARVWGRGVLFAPDELDNDAVLSTLAPVAAYLRVIHDQFPAFPIVLSFIPGISGFVDWFGSVVPSAMDEDRLNIADPAVIAAVASATQAIERLGEEVGQNPALAIMRMWPPAIRRSG